MRTQTGPRFNVSSEGRGTTTRVAHPYPYGTSRAGNRTRVVVGGVPDANHYTTGPAVYGLQRYIWLCKLMQVRKL